MQQKNWVKDHEFTMKSEIFKVLGNDMFFDSKSSDFTVDKKKYIIAQM